MCGHGPSFKCNDKGLNTQKGLGHDSKMIMVPSFLDESLEKLSAQTPHPCDRPSPSGLSESDM